MVYIGHQNPLLIFPDNVRDDIIPNPPQVTFLLSQTVPGGYEGNLVVIRRKFKISSVIEQTSAIEFISGVNEIVSTDPATSQILSQIKEGDAIIISGAVNPVNNGTFIVNTVGFDGNTITFTVSSSLVDESLEFYDVSHGKDETWEILKPEVDYTIDGIGPNLNREITFSEVLEETDECYVIHRGSATYNLVPSNNSVGPDQLSHNLRNFSIDRFDGDGVEIDFTLSQEPVNGKAILVTVDGEVLDGDDLMAPPFPYVGDWEIIAPDTLRFHVAPANLSKIRVLHLGFSTVSRRAALSDGQLGVVAPGSITSLELANNSIVTAKIANNAITNSKIANDAVNENKILLSNNQPLRALRSDSAIRGIIKLNATNETVVQNDSKVSLEVNSTEVLRAETGEVTITGDLTVTGTLNGLVFVPVGAILATARSSANAGYLLCRGQAVNRITYADLFAAIGTTYGPGDGVTTFNLPDLRQRFPLGQTDVVAQPATNLAASGGSIDHTHNYIHTHGVDVTGALPNHIHSIGTLAGTHAHTHTIDHVHDIRHDHATARHAHTHILTAVSGGVHRHFINTMSGGSNGGGAASGEIGIHTGGTGGHDRFTGFPGYPADSSDDGAHSHSVSGSVGAGTVINTATVNGFTKAGTVVTGGAGMFTADIVSISNMAALPIKPATPNASGAASTSVVTVTGDTGNPTTNPNIDSNGNTISQSVSVTDGANPPYLVINYMIKT